MDFFRGRHSWRKLAILIEQLPPTSRFAAARAMDRETAAELLALEAQQSDREAAPYSPPLTEWDTRTELLAEIRDRLGALIQVGMASIPVAKGRARPKFRDEPFPRPVTALDQAREDQARAAAEQVLAWLFPHI